MTLAAYRKDRDRYFSTVGTPRRFRKIGDAKRRAIDEAGDLTQGGFSISNYRGADAGAMNGQVAVSPVFAAAMGVMDRMGDTAEFMKGLREEIEESKKTLEGLANQANALGDAINPVLLQQITTIRSHRMTVLSEVRDTLAALKDIRSFLLAADYDVEMARLERLIAVCRAIQELKAAGVFDAVCDSAIRLALKEPAA